MKEKGDFKASNRKSCHKDHKHDRNATLTTNINNNLDTLT